MKRSGTRSGFLLALLIAACVSSFAAWHAKNDAPLGIDDSAHYLITLKFHKWLKAGNFAEMMRGYYPPLFYAAAAALYHLTGYSEVAASFVVFLWFLLLLILTYFLAGRLFGDRAAIWAAVALASMPYMTFMSRQIFIEVPVATFFVAFLLAAICADPVRDLGASALCGALLGLALLTKWTSAFFLLAPSVWLAVRSLRHGKRGLVKMAVLSTIALAIALPWYLLNWREVVSAGLVGTGIRLAGIKGFMDAGLICHALWYPEALVGQVAGLPLSLLAVAGLPLVWSRKPVLLVFLIAPFVLLGLIPYKNPRFIVPVLPLLAVFCGAGMALITSRLPSAASLALRVLVLAYCAVLAVHCSFGISGLHAGRGVAALLFPPNDDGGVWDGSAPRPRIEEWDLQGLYRRLIARMPLVESAKVAVVSPGFDFRLVNHLRIMAMKDEIAERCWHMTFVSPSETDTDGLLNSDFLVLEEIDYAGVPDSPDPLVQAELDAGRRLLSGGLLDSRFDRIYGQKLPDGHDVILLENRALRRRKRIFADRSFFLPKRRPHVAYPVRALLGGTVEFLGATVECEGGIIRATYLWRCIRPMRERYRIFVHFEGPDTFGQDHWPLLGCYHTDAWKPGELIREYYEFEVPSGVRSGEYEVLVGMFDPETGAQLEVEPAHVLKDRWRIKAGTVRIGAKRDEEG